MQWSGLLAAVLTRVMFGIGIAIGVSAYQHRSWIETALALFFLAVGSLGWE